MLDAATDAIALTANLVDIESVSGTEHEIADAVEHALRATGPLTVERHGNVVLARTDLRRERRIVLAGHLDTVPIHSNLPSRREREYLYGCGTSDMKSGVAVMLRAAHAIGSGTLVPQYDISWVFYDCEEIEAERNGLLRMARERPGALRGDLAILLEPTDGRVEGGCQGTLRVAVRASGRRAHSARSWLGRNAIHEAAPILTRLAEYEARTVDVDGLTYREGLSAVDITGGVAGNVIPDECVVTVNFRYAPDRDSAAAEQHVREVFAEHEASVVDGAPAARPGLEHPLVKEFVAASGREPRAKYGWTDVARFAELGIPAVNFGPGDPGLAHKPEERVSVAGIHEAEQVLFGFLG